MLKNAKLARDKTAENGEHTALLSTLLQTNFVLRSAGEMETRITVCFAQRNADILTHCLEVSKKLMDKY